MAEHPSTQRPHQKTRSDDAGTSTQSTRFFSRVSSAGVVSIFALHKNARPYRRRSATLEKDFVRGLRLWKAVEPGTMDGKALQVMQSEPAEWRK